MDGRFIKPQTITPDKLSENFVNVDGSIPMEADLNMATHSINNLPSPTQSHQPTTLGYADNKYLHQEGGTMSGSLDMASHSISHLPAPTQSHQPVTLGYADDKYFYKSGGTVSGPIDMLGNLITTTGSPSSPYHLPNVSYNDDKYVQLNGSTMSGSLNMGTHSIVILTGPNGPNEVANLGFNDNRYAHLDGSSTMSGNLDMGDNNIVNVKDAVEAHQAPNIGQIDANFIKNNRDIFFNKILNSYCILNTNVANGKNSFISGQDNKIGYSFRQCSISNNNLTFSDSGDLSNELKLNGTFQTVDIDLNISTFIILSINYDSNLDKTTAVLDGNSGVVLTDVLGLCLDYGSNNTASGSGNKLRGKNNIIGGDINEIRGDNSQANGYNNKIIGDNAIVGGNDSEVNSNGSQAHGDHVKANADFSKASGINAITTATASQAHGDSVTASGYGAYAGGIDIIAGGRGSFAHGENVSVTGVNGFGSGKETEANGDFSNVSGYRSKANGVVSKADGFESEANGEVAYAGGVRSKANGIGSFNYSYNETPDNINAGDYSVILGGVNHNIATGVSYSGIIGGKNNTIAEGVENTLILGGSGVNATESNTTYVPGLKINGFRINPETDTALKVLMYDGEKYNAESVFGDKGNVAFVKSGVTDYQGIIGNSERCFSSVEEALMHNPKVVYIFEGTYNIGEESSYTLNSNVIMYCEVGVTLNIVNPFVATGGNVSFDMYGFADIIGDSIVAGDMSYININANNILSDKVVNITCDTIQVNAKIISTGGKSIGVICQNLTVKSNEITSLHGECIAGTVANSIYVDVAKIKSDASDKAALDIDTSTAKTTHYKIGYLKSFIECNISDGVYEISELASNLYGIAGNIKLNVTKSNVFEYTLGIKNPVRDCLMDINVVSNTLNFYHENATSYNSSLRISGQVKHNHTNPLFINIGSNANTYANISARLSDGIKNKFYDCQGGYLELDGYYKAYNDVAQYTWNGVDHTGGSVRFKGVLDVNGVDSTDTLATESIPYALRVQNGGSLIISNGKVRNRRNLDAQNCIMIESGGELSLIDNVVLFTDDASTGYAVLSEVATNIVIQGKVLSNVGLDGNTTNISPGTIGSFVSDPAVLWI